jgi:hypothetical protein
MAHPRRDIGEKMADVDYAAFAKMVYETAPAQMGLFNPDRVSEPILREIWGFMKDMGFRSFLWATLKPGENSSYTLSVDNKGHAGKGLPAEDITVSLVVPTGSTVTANSGGTFQGVKKDTEYVTNPGQLAPFRGLNPNPKVVRAKGDVAVWKIGKIAAGQSQVITFTVSGGTPNFTGSTITWNKPEVKRLPTVTLTDDRLAAKGDIIWGPSMEWTIQAPPKPAAPAAAPSGSAQRP